MRRVLFLVLSIYTISSACTGDCLTCHPALVPTINDDIRHKPMLTCIKCHRADPESMAECGSDCFECHKIATIEKANVQEHKVIRGCKECHTKMKEALLGIDTPKDQSTVQPLKDFLIR